MVEPLTVNQVVGGSSPPVPAKLGNQRASDTRCLVVAQGKYDLCVFAETLNAEKCWIAPVYDR